MNVTIVVLGALFAVMGVSAIAAPEKFLIQWGNKVLGREGRNEVRAIYGGYGLCVAGIMIYAAFTPSVQTGVVMLVVAMLAGMAGGRVVSAIWDRGISLRMTAVAIAEAACAVVLVAAV